jgi:hypothetical protein
MWRLSRRHFRLRVRLHRCREGNKAGKVNDEMAEIKLPFPHPFRRHAYALLDQQQKSALKKVCLKKIHAKVRGAQTWGGSSPAHHLIRESRLRCVAVTNSELPTQYNEPDLYFPFKPDNRITIKIVGISIPD